MVESATLIGDLAAWCAPLIDLVIAIQKVLDKSSLADLKRWVEPMPKGGAWHLISDYVFDDPDKHDSVSFVMLLHHDQLDVILDYIQNVAPVDIKDSRAASEGLISYLNSPVAFTFSFVLDDESRFLSPYARPEDMIAQLEEFERIASSMAQNSPGGGDDYFAAVRQRVVRFARELRQKGNLKLARKIFIVSAIASVMLDYLDQAAAPTHIAWTSDRDAILERHDGVVWDMASLLFYLLKGQRSAQSTQPFMIDKPKLVHVTPAATGDNHLDPLIRMADYMVGAVADMNLNTMESSHPKFEAVLRRGLFGSANHVLATVAWVGDGFLVRRLTCKVNPVVADEEAP